MRGLTSACSGSATAANQAPIRNAGSIWSRLSRAPLGSRRAAALVVAGCAAVSLVMTAGTAASGSVASRAASVGRLSAVGLAPPGPGQADPAGPETRYGALRAGLSRPEPAAMAGLAGVAGLGRMSGFVVLGGSPAAPAANPATDTVYVPIQCTTSFCTPNKPGHVVDLINTARCNPQVTSGCRVVATARVGTAPMAVAIDNQTGTVYVVNGTSNTVSVLNGARCNAHVTVGCGQPVATVKVGKFPAAAVINPATQTLYVGNLGGGTISVINAANCNARVTRGCVQPPRTVTDKDGPAWLDVDIATDTIYAANPGTANPPVGDTVSVINGATCNGQTGTGCGQTPPTVKVGTAPFGIAVDQASDSVYVPSDTDGTVSVIDGATCNATVTSGCHNTPPTVTTGANPQFVVVDHQLHTVFAVNSGDNTLSAINTHTCQGGVTSGCGTIPPTQRATAPDQGPGYNPGPNSFAFMPGTGTAYVVNFGGANIMSVTSTGRCNATNTTGCRRPAPAVPDPEYLISVDPATNTIYGGNQSLPQIDVINGATCNTSDLSGCAPVATIPMADPQANMGAGSIDQATHTLYAADPFSDTVSVINTATCNATHTAGCAATPPVIKACVGPGPSALNPATRSLYVPFGSNSSQVAVINAATCSATNTTGCGQAPGVVTVGQGTFSLAVSARTDTIYAPSTAGNTVAVINGATCNGTDHAAAGTRPPPPRPASSRSPRPSTTAPTPST